MVQPQYAIEEYKTLREEILQNQRALVQFFIVSVSVSVGVFGYGLKSGNPYIILAPLLLLVPGVYLVVSQWEHMFRIGAYIRIVLEPQLPGLGWENHWGAIRSSGYRDKRNPFWKFNKTLSVLVTFHGFQLLCVLAAVFLISNKIVTLLVVLPLIFAHIVHSVCFARMASNSVYHAGFWERYVNSNTYGACIAQLRTTQMAERQSPLTETEDAQQG